MNRPIAMLTLLIAASTAFAAPPHSAPTRLPLAFEANLGQSDPSVDFIARSGGIGIWLGAQGPTFAIASETGERRVLQLRLADANPAAHAIGEGLLIGHVNHYRIDASGKSIENARRFARVRYAGVLPGIDLVYHGDDSERLEYDFVVAPGADPSRISWQMAGVENASIEPDGSLRLDLGGSAVSMRAPVAYQTQAGRRARVPVAFELKGTRVAFSLGNYDRALALVIDPVVTYGSYLGGSDWDGIKDIARGSDGSLYLTGFSWSTDFPTRNPIHGNLGAMEAFVTKLTPDGSSLVYSTYVGGVGDQQGNAIVVDSQSRAVVCGFVRPVDQARNPFVLRLTATGTMSYSRVTATQFDDECLDVALDGDNALAVGYTFSGADFPRSNAVTAWNSTGGDAPFLLRYDSAGTLLQATLLPNHDSSNDAAYGVAAQAGHAFVTGTWSPSGNQDNRQAFVVKLDGDAAFPEAGEYLRSFGGSSVTAGEEAWGAFDAGHAIAVDASGRAFVAGVTFSADFALSTDAFQAAYSGGGDGFIARLSTTGSVVFASYLHDGNGPDYTQWPRRIAFDPSNTLYVIGDNGGNGGPWLARLPGFATQLGYFSYIGGFYLEAGPATGLALAGTGMPIIVGEGAGSRFPITAGAVQPVQAGSYDGYLLQLAERLPVLSVQSVTINEAAGCVDLVVRTDAPSLQEVRFDWTVSDGTANAGTDYLAGTYSNVGISTGSTIPNINLGVCAADDTLDEVDETITVTLSNVTGATLGQSTTTVTIIDNDAAPTLSIDNGGCTVLEGDTGTRNCSFVARLSTASGRTVSFSSATANATAGAGADYTAQAASVASLLPGQTSVTVRVPVLGDIVDEGDETFALNLSAVSNASPATLTGIGTITDDDAPPVLSIDQNGCTVAEATGAAASCSFVFRLSAPSSRTVSFVTATADGSAVAAGDYTAQSATTRSIPAGQVTLIVAVSVAGDALDEDNETFALNVSGVSGATPAALSATGTINDDDAAPSLTVDAGGCAATEGNGTAVSCNFALRLSAASGRLVSFTTATGNGTATGGVDFTAHASTTRSIAVGQTLINVAVPVLGDTLDENDETFTLALAAVTNATPAQPSATGTILDDDAAPTLSIDGGGCAVAEGDSSSVSCNFVARLSSASSKPVSFATATANATALAGSDYTGHASTARIIAAGQTTLSITVPVLGDLLDEDNETFALAVSGVGNATPASLTATGTITDGDAPPALSVDNGGCSVSEGNSGASTCGFVLRLSSPSGRDVTFSTVTVAGQAQSGIDFTAHATTPRSIVAGQTTLTVSVPVLGDALDESDETFTLSVSGSVNATTSIAAAVGTIVDDDAVPTLSVDNGGCSVAEGNTGTRDCTFVFRLSAASGRAVAFTTATANATAGAEDFTMHFPTARTFAAGLTTLSVSVAVLADTTDEADEWFQLDAAGIVNAVPGSLSARGTIVDDDGAPALSIEDVTQSEGNSGSAPATFTVRLLPASEQRVTVSWSSADLTATAGTDYIAASGTLVFAPGETTKTISLSMLGDTVDEPDETFRVALTMAINALLADAQAQATILDDDAAPNSPGTVSLESAQLVINENSRVAILRVRRAAGSDGAASVRLQTSNATATAGADYQAYDQQLSWTDGDSGIREVSIAIANNDGAEPDEDFTVTLSNATGAAMGSPSNMRIVIRDGELQLFANGFEG